MNIHLRGVNLVVLLAQPNKNAIKRKPLLELYPDSQPGSMFWQPDPVSPVIIEFPDKGVGISLVENRLQIQSRADGNMPSSFPDILAKVLNALGNQTVTAYGFNFDFVCAGLPEVKDIFGITVKPTSFQYRPNTTVKLSFDKEGTLFSIDLADGVPGVGLHINAHHEERTITDNLAQYVVATLDADWTKSQQLIKEVLGDAS